MRNEPGRNRLLKIPAVFLAGLALTAVGQGQTPAGTAQGEQAAVGAALGQYCGTCHSPKIKTAGVAIEAAALTQTTANAELWEKVIRQLRSQAMPPAGAPRPSAATYNRVATYLEKSLDTAAAAHPNPGELSHLHRLTRTEYQNSVRDLLAVQDLPKEMDYEELLPADNSASGTTQ